VTNQLTRGSVQGSWLRIQLTETLSGWVREDMTDWPG
jgi:hypothetical protein